MVTMVSTDMFESFAPALYISRLFCLQPLKWKKSDYNYSLTKSGAYIAYSICTVLFFVSASIYGLSQVYKIQVVYLVRLANHTVRYVTFTDVGVVLIPSVFGVAVAGLKVDRFLNYFDHLRKFDSLVQKQVPKSRKYLVVSVVTMAATGLVLTLDLVMWILAAQRERSIYVMICHLFPYYVCYCYSMVMELVYWQCVHSIKVRIMVLNDKFKESVADEGVNELFMKIDRKKISNVVDTLKADDLKKQLKSKKSLKLDQVRDLINAYQKLTEATSSVNDCYGLVILIVILGCLIHLLVTPYALYAIIFNTGNSRFIISQSIWMTGHVSRLLLIVEPCHGCLLENKNTAAIVCKLLCFDLEKEVREALEFFLAYLAQCPVVFTAFGLSKIHRGLLTTIAGAVTTYLVILFQFNK